MNEFSTAEAQRKVGAPASGDLNFSRQRTQREEDVLHNFLGIS